MRKPLIAIVFALLSSFALANTPQENLAAYKFLDKYLEVLVQNLDGTEPLLIGMVKKVRANHTECFDGTNEAICAKQVRDQLKGILDLMEQK